MDSTPTVVFPVGSFCNPGWCVSWGGTYSCIDKTVIKSSAKSLRPRTLPKALRSSPRGVSSGHLCSTRGEEGPVSITTYIEVVLYKAWRRTELCPLVRGSEMAGASGRQSASGSKEQPARAPRLRDGSRAQGTTRSTREHLGGNFGSSFCILCVVIYLWSEEILEVESSGSRAICCKL